jgi:hypothetical protein
LAKDDKWPTVGWNPDTDIPTKRPNIITDEFYVYVIYMKLNPRITGYWMRV